MLSCSYPWADSPRLSLSTQKYIEGHRSIGGTDKSLLSLPCRLSVQLVQGGPLLPSHLLLPANLLGQ